MENYSHDKVESIDNRNGSLMEGSEDDEVVKPKVVKFSGTPPTLRTEFEFKN